jgi:hypothetical protein
MFPDFSDVFLLRGVLTSVGSFVRFLIGVDTGVLVQLIHLCSDVPGRFVDNTRVYPKVSGLAASSENCKWYSTALCH